MKLPFPNRDIPPQRKALYYSGLGMGVLGLILFLSTFVSFALHFGDFTNFEGNARAGFLTAIVGMILLVAGGVLTGIGARGWAGSGVLLDPERAKQDLEPWARVSGGLTDAAFSEMTTVRDAIHEFGGGAQREVIKVKCQACGALNDEADKFCGQCGAQL